MPSITTDGPAGTAPTTAATPFEAAAQRRVDKHLDVVSNGHFSCMLDPLLSARASTAQRIVHEFGLFGLSGLLLSGLTIWGAVNLGAALGLTNETNSVIVLAYVLAVIAAIVGIAVGVSRVRRAWIGPLLILEGYEGGPGRHLLDAYEDAVAQLRTCTTEGIPLAKESLVAADAMQRGLEELATEHSRFFGLSRSNRSSYVRSDYADEAGRVADELAKTLAEAVADVEVRARMLFNERTTLAVTIPQSIDDTMHDLPPLKLSSAAQEALKNAREVLRTIA